MDKSHRTQWNDSLTWRCASLLLIREKKADWEISKLFYHIRLNLNFHNTLLWKLFSFSTLPASTDLEEHWTHFSSIFSLSVDTSRTAFPKCLLCFLFAVQTKQRKSPLNWRNGYFGPIHHLTCPLFPLQLTELLHWSFFFFFFKSRRQSLLAWMEKQNTGSCFSPFLLYGELYDKD